MNKPTQILSIHIDRCQSDNRGQSIGLRDIKSRSDCNSTSVKGFWLVAQVQLVQGGDGERRLARRIVKILSLEVAECCHRNSFGVVERVLVE